MKLKNLFFILLLGLTFASCSDDDDDDMDCTVLSETIIGVWEATETGQTGTFEFIAGGELNDPDGILIEGEANGSTFDMKTWELNSDDQLTVTASDGSQYASSTLDVTSFDCNTINLSLGGIINFKITRS